MRIKLRHAPLANAQHLLRRPYSQSAVSSNTSSASSSVTGAVQMDTIVNLCKKRGFIFPSAEVYNSMAGFFDYGPLGVEMKNNIKQLWWGDMVRQRQDMAGIDAAIIGPSPLFQASGHIDEFSDDMVDCRETKLRYRADQVHWAKVEAVADSDNGERLCVGYVCFTEDEAAKAKGGGSQLQETAQRKAKQLAKKTGVKTSSLVLPLVVADLTTADCALELPLIPGPDSGVPGSLTPPRSFNLMFHTTLGPVETAEGSASNRAYLRPETAQGIFTNFLNVQRSSRMKIPFGVAQIGKAFRNEITPRNYVFRSREFEMMEIEYFIPPEAYYSDKYFAEWLQESFQFLLRVGVSETLLSLKTHSVSQLAHYAKASTDIEFRYPFGVQELMGVAYRGSFDLSCHAKGSGKSFEYLDKENFEHLQRKEEKEGSVGTRCVPVSATQTQTEAKCEDERSEAHVTSKLQARKYVPHCIEPSVGVDRLFLALLVSAYHEEKLSNGETRTVLRLKRRVAPVKAAVLPLVKNSSDIMAAAQEVYALLRKRYNCEIDTSGAVGRRYRRADEIGVPFCVTVDFETLQDGCVTLRDRDSMEQRRVPIKDLELLMYQEIELSEL